MSESAAAESTSPTTSGRLSQALRGFVTGIGGLAYVFLIWTAVFYAIQLSTDGMTGSGWFILLLPAVVAAVIFTVALVLGRRRRIGVFVLVLLAGVGVSAIFLLNTFSYVIRNIGALTGS